MLGTARLRRPLIAGALVAALAGGLLPSAQASSDAEAHLLSRHNEARAAQGLEPLRNHGELTTVARQWARHMRDDYEAGGERAAALRHNPSMASQIPQRFRRAGENVGYTVLTGASDIELADRLHRAYMDSAAHRGNVLGDFDRVGIGAVKASDGTMWSATVFMLEEASSGQGQASADTAAQGSSQAGTGGSGSQGASEATASGGDAGADGEPAEPEPPLEAERVATFALLADDRDAILDALRAARLPRLGELLGGRGAAPAFAAR